MKLNLELNSLEVRIHFSIDITTYMHSEFTDKIHLYFVCISHYSSLSKRMKDFPEERHIISPNFPKKLHENEKNWTDQSVADPAAG